MIISLLTPVKGNLQDTKRMIDSVVSTVFNPGNIEIILYADNNDPEAEDFRYMTDLFCEKNIFKTCRTVIGPPDSISKTWNTCAMKANGDILMMTNDDIVYETPGWDLIIEQERKKFPDDIFVMWFNDTKRRGKLATFPIVSRKWYETVGYFTPGVFEFFYNDTWIWDMGWQLDRLHYLDHVVNRHLHKGTSLAQKQVIQRDSDLFYALTDQRVLDVEKLRKVMK
jgi:glycosyl transferase/beta-hydroxylase protein BlmF